MKRRLLLVFALIGAASACGHYRYAYAPVTTTGAEVEGHAAAIAPIPPEAPKGELRLASLGVANVGAPQVSAVFVRFVLDNQSGEEWSFDQAEQRIELEERGQRVTRPAQTASGDRPAVLRIAPKSTSSVDVLFPIGKQDEFDLARFDVFWTVHAGTGVVAGNVAFVRHLTTREPAPAAFDPAAPPPYRRR